MNKKRLLDKITASQNNVRFGDLLALIEAVGYRLDRIEGSHHVYLHPNVPVALNLQPDGGQAKPYQVRQALKAIKKYHLTLEDPA